MQGPDLIFFFQDSLHRFWNVLSNGDVELNANPYPLQFSPDGWQETGVKNVRNRRYWGIDRMVSSDFKYVEDAAKILKHILYTRGIEESVFLVICEQNLQYDAGVSYGYWYKQIFRSEIDLSTFEHNGAYVTCATVEEGLAKHLKANENTPYEFDLSVPDAITVKMDGVIQLEKVRYSFVDGYEIIKSNTSSRFIVPLSFLGKDGSYSPVAFVDAMVQSVTGLTVEQIVASTYYFGSFPVSLFAPVSMVITGTFKIKVNQNDPGATFNLRFLKTGQTTADQSLYQVISGHALTVGASYEIPISMTIPLSPGENVFLEWVYVMGDPSSVDIKFEFLPGSTMNVDYSYRQPTTYIRGLRPQYLFAQLIDKLTGGLYTAADCVYFGDLQNFDKIFTSGDGIRGIDTAKLIISFSQFFEFWDTYDAVGIQELVNTVLFDRKKILTDDTNLVDLGEVSKISIKIDKTLPFNELAVGYPDDKNENGVLNGKNAVNTTFNFSMGTTRTPRKYNKVSPVKTDCYAIENIRISTTNKDTTDNKADGDPYVLHVVDTITTGSGTNPDHYDLDRSYNAFVTGVDQASTLYNLELSPKNCVIRSGDFLHSCFYKADGENVKFISADRNAGMTYTNGSTVVVENADFHLGDLAAPFFTNVMLVVETDAPNELLEAAPSACFQFSLNGKVYVGIPDSTGVSLVRKGKQTYEFFSHPDNVLTDLIDYYGG